MKVENTKTVEDIQDALFYALHIPVYSKLNYKTDLEKVVKMLDHLHNEDSLFVLKTENDIIVGVMGLKLSNIWWAEQEVITDVVFTIDPEFRNYENFSLMLSKAEEYGKIKGVPLVINWMSNEDLDRKQKLFERKGFSKTGFTFTKEFE